MLSVGITSSHSARMRAVSPALQLNSTAVPFFVRGRLSTSRLRLRPLGLLRQASTINTAVRAPAEGWIKKSQAQLAALAAARKLAEDAVGTLAKAAP